MLSATTTPAECSSRATFEHCTKASVMAEVEVADFLAPGTQVTRGGEKSRGLTTWCARILSVCSVEPILVLAMMASMMMQVISQSWLLRLACDEMNSEVCPGGLELNSSLPCELRDCDNSTVQEELQRTVAQVQAWRSAVEFSVPLLLVPFLGAWSDAKPGRRLPVLLFALSGRTIQAGLALTLVCLPTHLTPSLTLAGLCLALPVALTASSMAVDMAAYSHISDTSATKVRTVRLGVANAFWCLGAVLGLLASGLLHREGGERLVFAAAVLLQLAASILAVWRVRPCPRVSPATPQEGRGWRLLLAPLAVATRRRAGRARRLLGLMMVNLLLAHGASCGRSAVMFLYTRLRFGWDEVEFGLYGTFLMLMEVVGSFIAMWVFSHALGLPDAAVGLMSCVSQLLSSSFYTLAASTRDMYIAPLVEVANGQVVVIPRAIVAKLTEPHEQGKVHALFGCVEAVVPLVFEPVYHSLYRATLSSVPQAVFYLSAALTVPPTVLFMWLLWGGGKNWIKKSQLNSVQHEIK